MKLWSLLIVSICACLLSLTPVLAAEQSTVPEKRIGIVIPMEHEALRAIVAGFEETVSANYPGKVRFDVENAEHDLNVQRAIIQKFINQKVDMVVPVATAPAQMAITLVKKQPIVGLAAMIPDAMREKPGVADRYTGVRDEISGQKQLDFMRAVLPGLKEITMIYSLDDKVIPEAKAIIAMAQKNGIQVQSLMIQNLSELYTVSQHIDDKSQAIFILKDNLIASGVNTLVRQAQTLKIPLITSDEGTVERGAAAALGVEEKQIGVEGGKLAVKILNGVPVKDLPIQEMSHLLIFVNKKSAQKQRLEIEKIKQYAQENNYEIRYY